MLEQVSTSVKFLAFFTASKTGKTGLTVTVDIYAPSGSQIVTGGSATAIGGGLYSYTLASNNSAEGEYAAIFKTTDSTVDAQHIPSLWVLGRAGVENLDAAVSSRSTLTAAQVNAEADTALADVGLTTTITGRIDQAISTRLAAADYTAPSVAPSVADIRTELSVELGRLDASVSSRLAGSSYTAPTTPPTPAEITSAVWAAADKTGYSLTSAERTAIAASVEGSLLNEADGQAVLNAIVGAIGNQNLSEVSLVAAVRADLERTGGKLDSIPTSSAPSASAVAGAVRSELATELARLDAPVSGATAPSAATVASAVRTELSTELGRVDAAVTSRMAATEAAKLDAVKAKTDALNTDRLANVATTNIVGTLLAQSQS
jgi:hypothetical protein